MKKIDALVKRVEFFERLAVYGNRGAFLKSLSQATPTVGGTPEADAYMQQFDQPKQDNVQTVPETTIVGNAPIPTDVQEMLSRITTVEGAGLPIKIDGAIGPETRRAMNAFKKKFPETAKMNDSQLFGAIKNQYNKDSNRYGTLSKPGAKSSAPQTPKRNPGDPLPPMGPGLSGVVTNTKATGIGEHAGNPPLNIAPKT